MVPKDPLVNFVELVIARDELGFACSNTDVSKELLICMEGRMESPDRYAPSKVAGKVDWTLLLNSWGGIYESSINSDYRGSW